MTFRAPTTRGRPKDETRCHFCYRSEAEIIGRLVETTSPEYAGAFACSDPDRDDCVEKANRRITRAGKLGGRR